MLGKCIGELILIPLTPSLGNCCCRECVEVDEAEMRGEHGSSSPFSKLGRCGCRVAIGGICKFVTAKGGTTRCCEAFEVCSTVGDVHKRPSKSLFSKGGRRTPCPMTNGDGGTSCLSVGATVITGTGRHCLEISSRIVSELPCTAPG